VLGHVDASKAFCRVRFGSPEPSAYAGACAGSPREHFARNLARSCSADGFEAIRVNAGLEAGATADAAREAIRTFLELDDFEDWRPSKRSRLSYSGIGGSRAFLNSGGGI
jgi:isopenicillin N synthase-like dioxygenase